MAKTRWELHAQICCPLWNQVRDPKSQPDPYQIKDFTPLGIDGPRKPIKKVKVTELRGLFR